MTHQFHRQVGRGEIVWNWRLGYHFAFLQDLLGADFVVAFWSLGVEEKFYILAALLTPFLIGRPLRQQVGVSLALIAVPMVCRALGFCLLQDSLDHSSYFFRLRSPFYMCWDGMFTGMLVAFLYQGRASIPRFLQANFGRGLTYLLHMLFMRPVREGLWSWLNPGNPRPFEFSPAFFALYLPVFLGLSTLAALILHYAVEKPFLLLKDRKRVL